MTTKELRASKAQLDAARQVFTRDNSKVFPDHKSMPSILDDLRAALDWIEQRATTEKDGLLVERLQKTIAKSTVK